MEFIGEMDMCTFLSLSREKYQKSATQGRPPGASLTEPTTCVRDPFAIGVAKESECAEDRGQQKARTNGGAPSALSSPEARRRKRKPMESSPRIGQARELGAPPRLRTSVNL